MKIGLIFKLNFCINYVVRHIVAFRMLDVFNILVSVFRFDFLFNVFLRILVNFAYRCDSVASLSKIDKFHTLCGASHYSYRIHGQP